MTRSAVSIAVSLVLVACAPRDASKTGDSSAALPADVERAVEVRRGMAAAPAKADSILEANGLTPAGFDSLMYRIAGDSALRAAYASAK